MSDEKTLGQIIDEFHKRRLEIESWPSPDNLRKITEWVAALSVASCRAVIDEAMAKHVAEYHAPQPGPNAWAARPWEVSDKPAGPPKPEAASEAGDWAMEFFLGGRTLNEFNIAHQQRFTSEARKLREAAERHYGQNATIGSSAYYENQLSQLRLGITTLTKERDAVLAASRNIQDEHTELVRKLTIEIRELTTECDRLEVIEQERDAALAECERLKLDRQSVANAASKPDADLSKFDHAPPVDAGEDELTFLVINAIRNSGCSIDGEADAVLAAIRPRFDAVRAERDKVTTDRDHWKANYDDMAKRAEAAEAERDKLKSNVAAGVAEMRRYVEGNGFEWQPALTSVDNVTTAIGWFGGALRTMKADRDKLAAELAEVREAIKWSSQDSNITAWSLTSQKWEIWSCGKTLAMHENKLDAILAAWRATKGKEPTA